jgi:hypothetical protein
MRRRLVRGVRGGNRRTAIAAKEDAKDESEGIEASQYGSEQPRGIEQPPAELAAGGRRATEQQTQDGIFAPEAGEGHDRRERQTTDDEAPECQRKLRAQATHLAHVLLAAQCMDDGAGAHEEQRLEVGVRRQVENTVRVPFDRLAHEHIGKLAHRRVGEHALDVALRAGDDGRIQRRRPCDHRNDDERSWGRREDRRSARDKIDARRHHCRSMYQRAHRRRTLHRVGQPDMQWELRRLGDCRDDEEDSDGEEDVGINCGNRRGLKHSRG